jgi:hypothetical protein
MFGPSDDGRIKFAIEADLAPTRTLKHVLETLGELEAKYIRSGRLLFFAVHDLGQQTRPLETAADFFQWNEVERMPGLQNKLDVRITAHASRDSPQNSQQRHARPTSEFHENHSPDSNR